MVYTIEHKIVTPVYLIKNKGIEVETVNNSDDIIQYLFCNIYCKVRLLNNHFVQYDMF